MLKRAVERASAPIACLALLALTLVTTEVRAWNDFGHMQVAAVAYRALDAKDRQRIGALLKLNPSYAHWIVGAPTGYERRTAFIRAATWADALKSDPAYTEDKPTEPTAAQVAGYSDRLRHAYWHYVNVAFSPDGTPLQPTQTPNVSGMISALRDALAAPETTEDVKSYALAWLLHLVGDVHQPLHCVARFNREQPSGDRGANLVEIAAAPQHAPCDDPRYCAQAPPTVLHAYVDSVLGSTYAVAPALAAAALLPAPNRTATTILDPEAWVREGEQLARTTIYVGPIGTGKGPFEIDPAYDAAITALAKRRVALAGIRLANLLHDAL